MCPRKVRFHTRNGPVQVSRGTQGGFPAALRSTEQSAFSWDPTCLSCSGRGDPSRRNRLGQGSPQAARLKIVASPRLPNLQFPFQWIAVSQFLVCSLQSPFKKIDFKKVVFWCRMGLGLWAGASVNVRKRKSRKHYYQASHSKSHAPPQTPRETTKSGPSAPLSGKKSVGFSQSHTWSFDAQKKQVVWRQRSDWL